MVTEKNRPMRYYAEGLLSFGKGCDFFVFNSYPTNTSWQITQLTENPSIYTKLSCFLPWVAEQYGLEYKASGQTDMACVQGQGDKMDGDEECSTALSCLPTGVLA